MTETSDTIREFLKETWEPDDVHELVIKEGGIVSQLPKETNFYERIKHVDVGLGGGAGYGTTYSDAKAARGQEYQIQFQVQIRSMHGSFAVERIAEERSEHDRGALIDAVDRKSTNTLKYMARRLGMFMWGMGIGDIGRVKSFTGSTITLYDYRQHRFFERGNVLATAILNTTAAVIKSGTARVSTVGRSNISTTDSTLVMGGTLAALMPNIQNDDYIYNVSDFNRVPHGIPAWIPATDPTSGDNFNSADRSVDAMRAAGVRTDGTGLSPREAAQLLTKDIDDNGPGRPTLYCLSSDDYYNLDLELQSAGAMVMQKLMAATIDKVSFGIDFELDTISFKGSRGQRVKVLSEPDIVPGRAYALVPDTWRLCSMGPMIKWTRKGRQEDDNDSKEWTCASDLNLVCDAPGENGTVSLTTLT